MSNKSWRAIILCPICRTTFMAGKVNRHIKSHENLTEELELKIRKAVIVGIRQLAVKPIAQKTKSRPTSATDVMNSKKQFFFTNTTVSGGAFGQGKKK
ncbi:hypothetical protein J7315_12385 [Providencia rettgeri]|uniref:hypothetical protein n=1 Tax=Providencia rettgeri TaxID=587 RepID=UPI001B362AFD|nr:hypothetical protein [Providencia rettgeri]MBQ0686863.1 hypothetical protein [Providencia rettgeri]